MRTRSQKLLLSVTSHRTNVAAFDPQIAKLAIGKAGELTNRTAIVHPRSVLADNSIEHFVTHLNLLGSDVASFAPSFRR